VAKAKVKDEVNAKEKPKTKTKHRGHQEGNIHQREDGRWEARIQITDPITGKRKRPSVYGKTRPEVVKKLTKLMSDHQMGINIAPEKMTLGVWIEKWLKDYAKPTTRTGTWEGYETNFRNHIKPLLGDKILTKLTTNDLQRHYNSKLLNGRYDGKGGLSTSTVRLIHAVIFSALKQAKAEELVPRNVAEFVRLPEAKKKKEVTPLSPEQITQFLISVRDHRDYAAFVLEFSSGLRRGELLALRWQDIDLETGECKITRSLVRGVSGELQINDPKTKASKRNIIVPQSAIDVLKEHKVAQNKEKMANRKHYAKHDLIFCDELGEPLEPANFVKRYKKLLKNAGLPNTSFHALRHSVATALLVDGIHIKSVSSLMGHSTIAITADIYSHVLEETKKVTANSLSKLIPEAK